MIAGSRSALAMVEDFGADSEAAAARVLELCFWATAKGAASIRSAIETVKAIFVRKRRSNIQSLNFENLTTIPRDSKYNHVALATFATTRWEERNADLPGMRYRPRPGRGRTR